MLPSLPNAVYGKPRQSAPGRPRAGRPLPATLTSCQETVPR
jgi:hypothetical protein